MTSLLRRLFDAAGVDFDQWRGLTRALMRMDVRTTRVQGGIGAATTRPQDNQAALFVRQVAMYILMGVVAALIVFFVADVMLAATLVITYVMFMVGSMVLIDHQSVITSPDDYLVLGSRPVSSRTYFAVRLANVLVYTLALTTAYGILPILAFGVGRGFHPLLLLAAVPAMYLSTTFTALVLVFSYVWVLRFVGAGRLSRVLSYLQLIIGVLVYGGYMLPGEVMRYRHAGFVMPGSPWLLLFPPTWFASYLAIANGSAGLRQLLPAAASVVVLIALARGLGGRLSLEYAERLGAIVSATASGRAAGRRARRPLWFRAGERRVVSLLVRAQFRNDQKFRMAVFGILPMTVLYMYMSFRDGPPPDPFSRDMASFSGWSPLSMAVLFFPMMLRMSLIRSDAYRASWIYFGTPVSRGRILRAQTDVVMSFFIVPYLGIVGAAMAYFSGHVVSVAVHLTFLGFASLLLLQSVTLVSPELPFSLPPQKMARSGAFTFLFFFIAIAGVALGPLLAWLVYVSAVRIVVVALLLVGASVALDRLTRVRINEEAEQLEFEE